MAFFHDFAKRLFFHRVFQSLHHLEVPASKADDRNASCSP